MRLRRYVARHFGRVCESRDDFFSDSYEQGEAARQLLSGISKEVLQPGANVQYGEEPSDSHTSVVPIVVQAGAAGGAPNSNEQAQGSGRVPSAEA